MRLSSSIRPSPLLFPNGKLLWFCCVTIAFSRTPVAVLGQSTTPAPLHPDIVTVLDVIGDSPGARWEDSYSVGDRCYCASTFDHDANVMVAETEIGWRRITEICDLLGPGPGIRGKPKYNDLQCGNGPPNDNGDEQRCPGRSDIGPVGCGQIGPKWNFDDLIGKVAIPDVTPPPSAHPDIVAVVSAIAGLPDPAANATASSYSVGDRCYCLPGRSAQVDGTFVDTSEGWMTIGKACDRVGPGPGKAGRPLYNDVQCGHGPPNDEGNEQFCPGRVDIGSKGCQHIGPKWNFSPEETPAPTPPPTLVTTSSPTNLPSKTRNRKTCTGDLIKNANMEDGFQGYWKVSGGGSLVVVKGGGVDGSNAIQYIDRSNGNDALTYRADELMDFNCLQPGATYVLEADIKLTNTYTAAGSICYQGYGNCPKIRFQLMDASSKPVVQLEFGTFTNTSWNPNDYNHLRANFTLPSTSAWDGSVSSATIDIRTFFEWMDITVDNFSITKVSGGTSGGGTNGGTGGGAVCGKNFLANSDMEAGLDGFWDVYGKGTLSTVPGYQSNTALKISGRTKLGNGPSYNANKRNINFSCLQPGKTYEVRARMKLLDRSTGTPVSCDVTRTCPKVRVYLRDDNKDTVVNDRIRDYDIQLTGAEWVPNGFNQFRATFKIPKTWDQTVSSMKLEVRDFPEEWDLVMDDFELGPVTRRRLR